MMWHIYLVGLSCMWACGAQIAMQVSYWKVMQVPLFFVEPKQNQTNQHITQVETNILPGSRYHGPRYQRAPGSTIVCRGGDRGRTGAWPPHGPQIYIRNLNFD